MLADWLYGFWIVLLQSVSRELPPGETKFTGLPFPEVEKLFNNVAFYVDFTPFAIFISFLGGSFLAFVTYKLALFLYKLIPFVS